MFGVESVHDKAAEVAYGNGEARLWAVRRKLEKSYLWRYITVS
jgi:hypothetical protein